MNFRTILVHLDHSTHCAARAKLASRWAKTYESHLVGLVPTGLYDGVIPAGAIPTGMTDFIAQSAEYLRLRAEAVSREFRESIGGQRGLTYEVRLVDGDAIDALVHHGRTSDLVVVGQKGANDTMDTIVRDAASRTLMEVGRPVLVVPPTGEYDAAPQNVVVAWDGSREAAMALGAALPVMQQAKCVTLISCWKSGKEDASDWLLLPDTVQYLLRHGIMATTERGVTEIDIGNALLSRVAEMGADLIVMGGYGHSRFRELMLGGVTRRILADTTVPVLMAH